jgi:hypothetical protein
VTKHDEPQSAGGSGSSRTRSILVLFLLLVVAIIVRAISVGGLSWDTVVAIVICVSIYFGLILVDLRKGRA